MRFQVSKENHPDLFLDDRSFAPEQWDAKGDPLAANIVLMTLCVRVVYLCVSLWTITWLARHMAKWSLLCIAKLRRCFVQMKSNEGSSMQAFVNGPVDR